MFLINSIVSWPVNWLTNGITNGQVDWPIARFTSFEPFLGRSSYRWPAPVGTCGGSVHFEPGGGQQPCNILNSSVWVTENSSFWAKRWLTTLQYIIMYGTVHFEPRVTSNPTIYGTVHFELGVASKLLPTHSSKWADSNPTEYETTIKIFCQEHSCQNMPQFQNDDETFTNLTGTKVDLLNRCVRHYESHLNNSYKDESCIETNDFNALEWILKNWVHEQASLHLNFE